MSKIRPFIIDDETRARVAEVVKFAENNWYRPGQSENPPGDDPRHTILFPFGYRCVFSITVVRDLLFRHLSVSVPSKDYPNPIIFYAIAELFGFTGWSVDKGGDPPKDWMLDINRDEHCIVCAQKLRVNQ
jgi:hypothetical protein